MYNILIMEDEEKIQEILKEFLSEYGYNITCAFDGLEGLTKFKDGSFDLILLDIMMPKIDGFSVLKLLRQDSDIPIILLTAMDDEEYQMKGFDMLADDYITKPFSMNLVCRRIDAVLRRKKQNDSSDTTETLLYHNNISLDKEGCEIFLNHQLIPMTYKEYELVKLFLENKNRVFSREELLRQIWGYDFIGDDTVINNHIMRIRKKLGEECIVTVRGMGYKLGK